MDEGGVVDVLEECVEGSGCVRGGGVTERGLEKGPEGVESAGDLVGAGAAALDGVEAAGDDVGRCCFWVSSSREIEGRKRSSTLTGLEMVDACAQYGSDQADSRQWRPHY